MRTDTFVVGAIEDGSYFTMAASTSEQFGMFYNLLRNLTFRQTPVGIAYLDLLYLTARTIYNTTQQGYRIVSVVLSAYSAPKQSNFLGYLNLSGKGLRISQDPQAVSFYTTDPSSYPLSQSLLSSVRYTIPGIPVEMVSCTQRDGQRCVNSTTLPYNGISPFIMMVPYLVYSTPNCSTLYNPTEVSASLAYSQCYYLDQQTKPCKTAQSISAFTSQSECSTYSEYGKYYYAELECGDSYEFEDLQGTSVNVNSSIGVCSDGTCFLNSDSEFTCSSVSIVDNDGDPTQQPDDTNTRTLIIVAAAIIIITLVIIVIMGLLFVKR